MWHKLFRCFTPRSITINKQTINDEEPSETCWICYEGSFKNFPLEKVCDCPNKVHKECIKKWQKHKKGTPEERHCRFCNKELPQCEALEMLVLLDNVPIGYITYYKDDFPSFKVSLSKLLSKTNITPNEVPLVIESMKFTSVLNNNPIIMHLRRVTFPN